MNTINPLIQKSINPSAADVRLIASPNSWMEAEAVRQLYAAAKLPGVEAAVGLPNLHPGKGVPVGAAFVTRSVIYPHLIGDDIGCGMALFKTDLARRDVKLDIWSEQDFHLEHPWYGDVRDVLAEHKLESTEFDSALGTIGGGGHFAELQRIEEVLDANQFRKVGLGEQQLVVLVHSGSRGLGESILRATLSVAVPRMRDQSAAFFRADIGGALTRRRYNAGPVRARGESTGLDTDSFEAVEFLQAHNFALHWAKANRALIARRFAATLGAKAECLWDGCHNSISRIEYPSPDHRVPLSPSNGERDGVRGALGQRWVHRKGAVGADSSFVVIPGSRGSFTYLVKPMGDGESYAWSLVHGAGRKWSRTETRLRMRERFDVPQLVQTPLGGRVICEERDLLYEEAPGAYKDIEAVIQDLVVASFISVIATFRPLLTYKTRKLRR